jgi:hypothetical protein
MNGIHSVSVAEERNDFVLPLRSRTQQRQRHRYGCWKSCSRFTKRLMNVWRNVSRRNFDHAARRDVAAE